MKYANGSDVFEGRQLTAENFDEVVRWCYGIRTREDELAVSSPVGNLTARTGDYVFKDHDGVFWTCAKDYFEEEFKPVEK